MESGIQNLDRIHKSKGNNIFKYAYAKSPIDFACENKKKAYKMDLELRFFWNMSSPPVVFSQRSSLVKSMVARILS